MHFFTSFRNRNVDPFNHGLTSPHVRLKTTAASNMYARLLGNLTVPSGIRRLFLDSISSLVPASDAPLPVAWTSDAKPPPHKPWLQYTLVGRTNAFEPLARCLCRLGPAIRGPWAAAALAGSSPGRVRSSGLPDSGVALSTRRASSATTCSRSRPLALALWRVCWVAPMAPVRAAGRKPLGDMLCWCVRWPARTDAATPSASS